MKPEGDLALLAAADRRLAETLTTEIDTAAPSGLPDWTIGHVLAHLVGNGHGVVRMAEAVLRDEVTDQYPGGREGRAAEIEALVLRPFAELADGIRETTAALAASFDAFEDRHWRDGEMRMVSGSFPIAELPVRRLLEVEVHHLDLGLGHTPDDWPGAFVERWLQLTVDRFRTAAAERGPAALFVLERDDEPDAFTIVSGGAAPGSPRCLVRGTGAALLAWLLGRRSSDAVDLAVDDLGLAAQLVAIGAFG